MDIEYSEYKAVITVTDEDGAELSEFTTWRGDIINNIVNASLAHFMEKGHRMSIEIGPNEEEESLVTPEDIGTGC